MCEEGGGGGGGCWERRESSSNETVRKKSFKWMGIIERKTIHIFNIWGLGSVIELRTDGRTDGRTDSRNLLMLGATGIANLVAANRDR